VRYLSEAEADVSMANKMQSIPAYVGNMGL